MSEAFDLFTKVLLPLIGLIEVLRRLRSKDLYKHQSSKASV